MSNAGMQHSHFITKYLIRFRQLTQTHSRRRPQTFPVCFQAHTWALSPSTEEDEHERPGWPTPFPPSLSVWRSHIHCGHVTLCKTPAALSTAVTSAAISRLPTIDPVEISHLAMNKEIEASVAARHMKSPPSGWERVYENVLHSWGVAPICMRVHYFRFQGRIIKSHSGSRPTEVV